MINSGTEEYYRNYYGAYLNKYFQNKSVQDKRLNYIIAFIIICILMAVLAVAQPLFAQVDPGGGTNASVQIQAAARCDINEESPPANIEKSPPNSPPKAIISQQMFEKNIRAKYNLKSISFPSRGIAHIKTIKYINQKPIKINIVELNTNVNPNLKIKPQIAGNTLNTKTTVRTIANKENAIIAINGGFFKPQTGTPLGALMINGKVLTGAIYNRVGIAIFEDENNTSFKMDNINFDIKAQSTNYNIKIDNINQPRMLQSYMLLYTSEWGKMSPWAPKNGYNLLIDEQGRGVKISANPIEIKKDQFVLSGNKEILSKLARDGKIEIKVNVQENLKGAKHIIAAGPYLIKNSKVFVDAKEQKLLSIAGKNPRSAIGFKKDGTFIIVAVDGREQSSVGFTLYELASFMKSLGCEYAMNLDGGSSSAIYVKGKIANSALNREGIRVSNALTVIEDYDERIASN